jgi:4'-phosphopantetheinyl transferase
MDNVKLHLWCARPDDLIDAEAAQACLQLLSADELSRWRRYKFERSRREYLATHALARTAISHQLGIAPNALRFHVDGFGKPSLVPECGLTFNLSNSSGLVVCIVGESGALGVDVEPFARAESICQVAQKVFSPLELAQLSELSAGHQLQRSLQLWTLKEAYIKARGMGFKLPLTKFSLIFGELNSIRLLLEPELNDDATRWNFCVASHAEHCIALMVENDRSPQLQLWEARPASASPRPIHSVSAIWNPGA